MRRDAPFKEATHCHAMLMQCCKWATFSAPVQVCPMRWDGRSSLMFSRFILLLIWSFRSVDMLNEIGSTMLHWQGKERTESRGSKLVAVGTALGLGASEYLASLERARRSFVLVASLGPSEHLYFFSATIAFKVCSVYDFLLLSHLSSKPQWHCAP